MGWTIGDTPSNCYETKGHCELAHVITPLKFLEAPLGTCSPDPHCSWKADKCHCCYNGGCDFEQACKCGHAPPQQTGNPDPHCTHEGEKCKCCYNGGCDYEDLCKCGGPAIAPLSSHLEESNMVSEDSRECGGLGRPTRPCCIDGFSCKKPN